jgi:2-iminobutanoate/2-iminopropanoate deaminase
MPKRIVRAEKAPKPLGDYSQAWEAQNTRLIFVAGQVSVDMEGKPVGVGDIALQTRTVLENVKRVLEGAGARMEDVIKTNIYVTNMAEYRAKTGDIRREYFAANFPASTLVEVKSLARPEFLVEIEVVAAAS